MLEKKRPRVILLESTDIIQQSAALVLSKEGWDVTCETESKSALNTLKNADKPYALFIANYRLPKMEGDDILGYVKKISPLTQRMLMVSENEPEILISAINKAEIHACITAPFQEEDLVQQSRVCFSQFKRAIKRKRLKNVTVHQNKQLYKVAQKLQKKEDLFQKKIEKTKAYRLKLKSRRRDARQKNKLQSGITLPELIEHKQLPLDAESFAKEFLLVSKTVQSAMNTIARKNGFDPFDLDWDEIFPNEEPDEKRTQTDAESEEADTREEDESPEDDSQVAENESETGTLDKTEAQTPDNPPENGPVPAENEFDGLVEKILAYAFVRTADIKSLEDKAKTDTEACDDSENPLDSIFELIISDSQTRADIKRKHGYDKNCPPSVNDILDWLSNRLVSNGIIDDDDIKTWLQESDEDVITIARGKDAVPSMPGIVTYHFESDFTNPGKINEDGSIDFRDRGDIPYVEKDTVLAKKRPARQGKSGVSVSGIPIPVEEVVDPVMAAGPGTTLSEDGLSVIAATDGQPGVDPLGTLSVSPELIIKGDVDFETGNIDFNGNIVVKGMVKEGFKVKGISLTAQEIEGGIIDLCGDLSVSAGITDADISVKGNIHAKFINNSTINCFGDTFISREILDSTLLLSGSCQNTTGHIISSDITAKLGIEAGNIGTSASRPSRLKVGVHDHIDTQLSGIDKKLEESVNKTNLYRDDIKKLEDEDQALYEKISENAHVQDRSQLEIKEIKATLPEIEKSKDMVKLTQASEKIKQLVKKAKDAEQQLNVIFEKQDKIAGRIKDFKRMIEQLEEKNKAFVLEKRALKDFGTKFEPKAVINISKTIAQDTVIKGPHSSIVVKEDKSRCKVVETRVREEGVEFYELIFSELKI